MYKQAKVHFIYVTEPSATGWASGCGNNGNVWQTSVPANVTCKSCINSKAFRKAVSK